MTRSQDIENGFNTPLEINEPRQAFRHDKFQLRMPSHSEGPGIWLSVWRCLLTHCLYERATEVLARLRGCADLPEPSLLAWAIKVPNSLDAVQIKCAESSALKMFYVWLFYFSKHDKHMKQRLGVIQYYIGKSLQKNKTKQNKKTRRASYLLMYLQILDKRQFRPSSFFFLFLIDMLQWYNLLRKVFRSLGFLGDN